MIPKYLQSEHSKRIGNKGEKKVRQTIASGALWIDKGDISTDKCLIEVKTTQKKSFRLMYKTLEKIFNEAHSIGKEPALIIQIKDLIFKGIVVKK
jgi:hypothetical protein